MTGEGRDVKAACAPQSKRGVCSINTNILSLAGTIQVSDCLIWGILWLSGKQPRLVCQGRRGGGTQSWRCPIGVEARTAGRGDTDGTLSWPGGYRSLDDCR